MANTNRPGGLKPVRHLNGNPWNGKARMYSIASEYAVNMFVGDAVISGGSADASGKYPTVQVATANCNIRGVAIAFSDQPYIAINQDNLNKSYHVASTAGYCLVVDDPDVIFEIQEDNDGGNLAATDAGANTDLVATAGSTTTGLSNMELDSTVTGAGAVAQFRILGLSNKEDNALGAYAKWDVLINEHEFRSVDLAGVD